MAKMIADGQFERPGVHPPEILGQVPGLVEALVTALHTRGVRFERRRDTLNEKAPS
jgi:saccharopine dehydrogenase-like NADP-dependent oxidoreductase